jgi:hypothetical protein
MAHPSFSRLCQAVLLLCGTPVLAHADTVWQCWYDRALYVACSLSQAAPATPVSAQQQQMLNASTVPVRPGPIPPLVGVIQTNPGALKGNVIKIPLHVEPSDPDFVAELAQSVMCGKQTDCTAVYSPDPTRHLASAMALADAIDPVRRQAD